MTLSDDELITELKARSREARQQCGVASEATLKGTERRLKFPFPPFLRRVYQEVANGGFGPNFELYGTEGGYDPYENSVLISLYSELRKEKKRLYLFHGVVTSRWPEGLLPIGWDDLFVCAYCLSPESPVYLYDHDRETLGDESVPLPISRHTTSLQEWFRLWIDGVDLDADSMRKMRPDLFFIQRHYFRDNPKGYPLPITIRDPEGRQEHLFDQCIEALEAFLREEIDVPDLAAKCNTFARELTGDEGNALFLLEEDLLEYTYTDDNEANTLVRRERLWFGVQETLAELRTYRG